MHSVTFAVLVLECIHLVSCATNGKTYLDEYNKLYKECRQQSKTERNTILPEKATELFDEWCKEYPRFIDFKDELIEEIECFDWITTTKIENDLKKLMVPFYVIYLVNYYASITSRQWYMYDHKEVSDAKLSLVKTLTPIQEQLEDDFKLVSALLYVFAESTSYETVVKNVARLRKERGNSLDNDQSDTIDEDTAKLMEVTKTLQTEKNSRNSNLWRAAFRQKAIPMKPDADVSHIALFKTNPIFADLLPGCDLPKKLTSERLNDNKNDKLLKNVRDSETLDPSKEFTEESRIIKIIQALVTSDYEKETGVSASESESESEIAFAATSASAFASESASASDDEVKKDA